MSTTAQVPTQALAKLMADIRYVMLTTVDRDGRMYSRPMTSQPYESDGVLWFLTDRRTHPAEDIARNPQVNVSGSHEKDSKFISITGSASVSEDRDIISKFWKWEYAVWFPAGPQDANLVLLRVDIEQADYWNSPSSWVGRLLAFTKALTKDDQSGFGTRGHVDFTK